MRYDPAVRDRLLADLAARGLPELHRELAELVPAGSRVLDLGCATGYLAAELARRGARVTGIEIDPEMAAAAAGAGAGAGFEVRRADLDEPEALAGLAGPFDVMLAADLIEHLRDPWALLARLRPLLAPGGRLIVTLPNAVAWPMRMHILAGRFDYADSGMRDRTHLRFFSPASFRAMAGRAGYRVASFRPTEGWLPLVGPRPRRLARAAARLWPGLLSTHGLWVLAPAGGGPSGTGA